MSVFSFIFIQISRSVKIFCLPAMLLVVVLFFFCFPSAIDVVFLDFDICFLNCLSLVWANHGDDISIQYSGTPALKGDFVRYFS